MGVDPGSDPKTISEDTHPELHWVLLRGLQEPIPAEQSSSQPPVNSSLTYSHSDVNERVFPARVWIFIRSRETIKSAGRPAGHGAVKGCVNSSAPFHFCWTTQSLRTGALPLSSVLKTTSGKLGVTSPNPNA